MIGDDVLSHADTFGMAGLVSFWYRMRLCRWSSLHIIRRLVRARADRFRLPP